MATTSRANLRPVKAVDRVPRSGIGINNAAASSHATIVTLGNRVTLVNRVIIGNPVNNASSANNANRERPVIFSRAKTGFNASLRPCRLKRSNPACRLS